MWVLVAIGVLFVVGGASGSFVYRGTNSSALLVVAGIVIIVFAFAREWYRLRFVPCPVCSISVMDTQVQKHIARFHPWELDDEDASAVGE